VQCPPPRLSKQGQAPVEMVSCFHVCPRTSPGCSSPCCDALRCKQLQAVLVRECQHARCTHTCSLNAFGPCLTDSTDKEPTGMEWGGGDRMCNGDIHKSGSCYCYLERFITSTIPKLWVLSPVPLEPQLGLALAPLWSCTHRGLAL
jgi:hypothetical protein